MKFFVEINFVEINLQIKFVEKIVNSIQQIFACYASVLPL